MITAEMLESAGACSDQVDLFHKHFPNGTEVTVEIAVSVARVFDWDWAADQLLSDGERDKYDTATRAADDTYSEEYRAAIGNNLRWPYSEETQKAIEAAGTRYHETRAAAWAHGWLNDHTASVAE